MKEVQIRRREIKSFLPPEVSASSKSILASHFVGGGPLMVENMEEHVATHLGMSVTDKDFPKEYRNFWAELRLDIPSDGKVLRIDEINGKPINVYEWIVWKWACKHKLVAMSRDEMERDPVKKYYIHDPEKETDFQNQGVRLRAKAFTEFANMADNEERLNHIIRIVGTADPERMSVKQKQNWIDAYIGENPKRFLAVATDKKLETKSFISELISGGILNKIGNQVYYIEVKLGDDLDEAVLFLDDKKNSGVLLQLKAKLEEVRRSLYGKNAKPVKINERVEPKLEQLKEVEA